MSANKKNTKLTVFIALALLVGAGAISYFTSNKSGGATQQVAANDNNAQAVDTATSTPANATGLDGVISVQPGNPIIAKIDGKDVMRDEVYRFIQTMPANIQQMPAAQVYPMAVEQVINTRLVQAQAEKGDLESSEKFQTELEIAKKQLLTNMFLQQKVDAAISDKDIEKEYKKYIKEIPEVEERRARHILVETEDKAKAVLDKLNKDGDFEALAKELSTGPTGPNGGDLGYFSKDQMVPEFSEAAFGMKKKNTVYDKPVKTQFGWHIIQLVDIRNRAKPSMEQMTPAIKAELTRSKVDELIQGWRKKAKIEQFDINGQPLKEGANATGLVPAPAPAADTDASNKAE
jgi:peptidyl-prolyl cis-trans isomerase C